MAFASVVFLTGAVSFIFLFFNRNKYISFLMTGALFTIFIYMHALNLLNPVLLWITFFILLFWIFSVTQAPVRRKRAGSDKTGIIHVKEGSLQGVYNKNHTVEIYAGIPYAKPPTGELRWRAPRDPEPYDHLLQADSFSPMAMQKQNSLFIDSLMNIIVYKDWNPVLHERVRYPMSEDCLYLNIWKPAGKHKKLPVLFYIHGGSLATGQSWWDDYSGESDAEKGIIFITISYRLGLFGFFADEQLKNESPSHSTGMYGFLDQIKALTWVKNNIEAFGGDPDNITIAGESAGSSCVNALCTSPLAHGLFSRAIGESSSISAKKPVHSLISMQQALAKGNEFKKTLHIEKISDLRRIPALMLVRKQGQYGILNALCIDGWALPCSPYESYTHGIHNETALLNGYNLQDGDFFASLSGRVTLHNYKEKVRELYKDQTDCVLAGKNPRTNKEADTLYKVLFNQITFGYGHIVWSRLAGAYEPVYLYLFAIKNRRISSNHTSELQYAYGNLDKNKQRYNENDFKLSEIMQNYWINFVKNGNPNKDDLPEWKTFDGQQEMRLDENPHMEKTGFAEINAGIERLDQESASSDHMDNQ